MVLANLVKHITSYNSKLKLGISSLDPRGSLQKNNTIVVFSRQRSPMIIWNLSQNWLCVCPFHSLTTNKIVFDYFLLVERMGESHGIYKKSHRNHTWISYRIQKWYWTWTKSSLRLVFSGTGPFMVAKWFAGHKSDQIIIFHQPGFHWNKGISLP